MKKIIALLCFVSLGFTGGKEDFLKDHVANVLPSIQGWCSQEKAMEFIDLVLKVKPEYCVEIGVYGGCSVFPVASALKYLGKGTIIGIDSWEKADCMKYIDPIHNPEDFKWWSTIDLDGIYSLYTSLLRRFDLNGHVVTMKATSERALPYIPEIDILYIDGAWSEEDSVRDVENYLPRVKLGGYIWVNDAIWEQKQMALEILEEKCEFIKCIDSGNCILFQKNKE